MLSRSVSTLMTEPDALEAPAGGLRRQWLGVTLAVFIVVMLALWLDIGQVAEILSHMPLAAVAAVVLMILLDRIVMAWKWLLLLRVGGVHLPLRRAARWYLQGTISAAFMPTQVGGDLLRGYWASRPTRRRAFVFASLVMEKVLGLLSALHFGIAGSVVLLCWLLSDYIWLWPLLGIAAIVGTSMVFILSLHARVHSTILKLLARTKGRKVLGLLHRLYVAYSHFSMARGALLRNYLITLGGHLLKMGVYVLIAVALGYAATPLLLFAVTTLHALVMRIPISPDGWGIGELSAVALYGLIGIHAEGAFAIMLVYHLAVLIACSPGLLFLLRGEHSSAAHSGSTGDTPVVKRSR